MISVHCGSSFRETHRFLWIYYVLCCLCNVGSSQKNTSPKIFSAYLLVSQKFSYDPASNFRGFAGCTMRTLPGSRSPYGAITNHVGMTGSQKNWISDAWEGYVPSLKGSLKFCHKLTPPIRNWDQSRSLESLRVRLEPSPLFELSRSCGWSSRDGKVGVFLV